MIRLKDLPACGQTVELWWGERRLLCGERLGARRLFTQTAVAVRPRARLTRTAPRQGRHGDRDQQPVRRRCGGRVRGVLADRSSWFGQLERAADPVVGDRRASNR
jgi:hypothetical protein